MNIADIKNEIKIYEETELEGNPSYAKTQPELLDLIEKYSNSQFRDAEYDAQGYKKLFYNISDNPRDIGKKETDLDLGDIHIETESGHNYYIGWLYEKELRFWMKENDISVKLNQLRNHFIDYGTCIAKKVKDKVYIVHPKNLISDPEAENLEDSEFIIEVHQYAPKTLIEMGRKKGWYMNKIIDIVEKSKGGKIKVYERYAEEDENGNNFFLIAKIGEEFSEDGIIYEGRREPQYKAAKMEEVFGRFLGRGVIEKLLEPQIAKNDINYYLQKGLRISSLHLFQSKDPNIGKNTSLLEEEDGAILHVLDDINVVPLEERNLPAYSYLDQLWEKNIEERSFSYEAMGGQRPPAGLTLGSHQLSIMKAGGYFEDKKDSLAILFRDIITDWVIPGFKKKKKKLHKLPISKLLGGKEDSSRFFNALLAERMRKKRLEMMKKGKYLMGADWEIIRGIQAKILKEEDIIVPDEIYENINEKVTVVITGEQIGGQAEITVLNLILNMANNNPAVFNNPTTRRIISKILDRYGINPVEILPEETPEMEESLAMARGIEMGGSLPAPNITTPTMVRAGARV